MSGIWIAVYYRACHKTCDAGVRKRNRRGCSELWMCKMPSGFVREVKRPLKRRKRKSPFLMTSTARYVTSHSRVRRLLLIMRGQL